MRWRSIVLAALSVGFGIAASICVAVGARLNATLVAIQTHGDVGLTAEQSASVTAMISQATVMYLLTGPLVVGSLLCAVGLLVVLAWRWQAPRREAD